MSVFDDVFIASLWGNQLRSYSFQPTMGALGGLLIMWDSFVVEVWSTFSLEHALLIHSRFIDSNDEFHLFNIACL